MSKSWTRSREARKVVLLLVTAHFVTLAVQAVDLESEIGSDGYVVSPSTTGEPLKSQLKNNEEGVPSLDLRRNAISGGGGISIGEQITVRGTGGQATVSTSSGENFIVRGGFWHSVGATEAPLFIDGFETGDTSAWSVVSD